MDKRIANIESDLSMIKYAVAKFEDDENIIDLCTRIICSACDAADVDSDTKYIILRSLKKLADDAKYPDTLCLHRKIVVHEHAYNKSNKKGKIVQLGCRFLRSLAAFGLFPLLAYCKYLAG